MLTSTEIDELMQRTAIRKLEWEPCVGGMACKSNNEGELGRKFFFDRHDPRISHHTITLEVAGAIVYDPRTRGIELKMTVVAKQCGSGEKGSKYTGEFGAYVIHHYGQRSFRSIASAIEFVDAVHLQLLTWVVTDLTRVLSGTGHALQFGVQMGEDGRVLSGF